jgi:hypothetical protein
MVVTLQLSLIFFLVSIALISAFAPTHGVSRPSRTVLHLFGNLFEREEAGPLGKGITVGKVQVALLAPERGRDSIFGDLERKARSVNPDSPAHLALLAKAVCLALLRRSDDWTDACSESKWFKLSNAGEAESLFNDWANAEARKFEKVGPMVPCRIELLLYC